MRFLSFFFLFSNFSLILFVVVSSRQSLHDDLKLRISKKNLDAVFYLADANDHFYGFGYDESISDSLMYL